LARLSLYLGRAGIAPENLLKPIYRPTGEKALPPATALASLPFSATAYLVTERINTPAWTGFVRDHFDIANARNVSTAFVMVFLAVERSWALTFGTGFHAIDLGAVTPGFGLRVCANSLNPAEVRSMENRRIGAVTRQQRTHVSQGSRISELGVVLDQDWVRYLAGRSAAEDLTGTLAGSDALNLTTDTTLSELPTLCSKLLQLYKSKAYRDSFPFIDQLRPLRQTEALIAELDAEIEQRLAQRDDTSLYLAPPQIPDDSRLAGYRVWANRKHVDIPELNLAALYVAFGELSPQAPLLDTVHIADLSDEGAPGSRDPLRRYLVAEISRSKKLYVHSLGSWFEIGMDYATSITTQVAALDDVTDELALPAWENCDEKAYNNDVAQRKGWVCLDGKSILHGGSNQKIELCDLLTDGNDHVCVKKAASSATLSHLFNQAGVVSNLYRNDPAFLTKAKEKLESIAPGRTFPDLISPRFVYAIGTTKQGSLANTLFFFSKLALVAKVAEIRSRNHRVAIARIEMT
jgi:uncharacterized protein (TIGR04141 family)